MKEIIIFDLDGTLANNDHRKHLVEGKIQDWDAFFDCCDKDIVIPHSALIYRALICLQFKVFILSGRSCKVRDKTVTWLKENLLFGYEKLWMRPENNCIPDEQLKQNWLNQLLIDGYNILAVFDDRNKVVDMWRKNNIPCFQVNYGDF